MSELTPRILAAMLGFLVGGLALSSLSRWAMFLYMTIGEYRSAKQYPHLGRKPSMAMILLPALLYSGPWFLAALVYFNLKIIALGHDWGYWFLGGWLFYSFFIVSALVRYLRRAKPT